MRGEGERRGAGPRGCFSTSFALILWELLLSMITSVPWHLGLDVFLCTALFTRTIANNSMNMH